MSFETNKFCVVKKKRLEKSTFIVECNITNETEIDKILSVCHSANVENVEILNGVANYSGCIDICILYSTIDGEIGTINSSCPFASKFEDSSICVGDKIAIKLSVEDYSVESLTSSNIKLNCTVMQSGQLICNREINKISTNDENMCIKEDEMIINTLVGEAKEVFSVESEYQIKEPIKKILLTESQATIKNVESGVNFVSVTGEVINRILYLTEKDRFESAYTTENFKEEIELEGVTREAVSDAEACVRKNLVKCEVDQDDKGVTVKFVVPVEVRVFSYLERPELIIKDIYCQKCGTKVPENVQYCPNCGAAVNCPGKPKKDKIVAGILAILFGGLGIHYFYMGKTTAGIISLIIGLCSCYIWGLVMLIQGILILTMTDEAFMAKYVDTDKSFPLF